MKIKTIYEVLAITIKSYNVVTKQPAFKIHPGSCQNLKNVSFYFTWFLNACMIWLINR